MTIAPKISATCEVLSGPNRSPCGALASYGYPAMRGGFMALCTFHAYPHERYVLLVGEIRHGVRHPWWDEMVPPSADERWKARVREARIAERTKKLNPADAIGY